MDASTSSVFARTNESNYRKRRLNLKVQKYQLKMVPKELFCRREGNPRSEFLSQNFLISSFCAEQLPGHANTPVTNISSERLKASAD